MKKNLLKTALFISIVIGMSYMSCKPGSFTEEDAMLLQRKLEREKILFQDSLNTAAILLTDSLNTNSAEVTYTLCLIDASKSTLLKSGDAGTDGTKGGLPGATVTMTQGGTTVSKSSASTGLVVFDNLKQGLATLHVVLTGYSEVNAVIDFSHFSLGTYVNGGIQFGNVLPMIPLSGSSTGTIKGTIVCESDLTNKAPEIVPVGTKVIASVSDSSSALSNISGGIVLSISYDNLSLEALTDAGGAFVMAVPGTSMGLDYSLKVSDFTANQSLLMLTKGGLPVTGVQTIPAYFGSTFSSGSSTVPNVNPVIVTIGAPDYTFTQATATAVVSNQYGLDYFQITNAGNYYYYPGYTPAFTSVTVDSPTQTGGTNAVMSFTVNSWGQITATNISTKGSGYATTVQGSTFTLPYIKTAAKMKVLTVNGSGQITSYNVSTAGVFYSTSNLEFVKTSGNGIGATLPMPTTLTNPALIVGSSYLSFSGSTGILNPVLGTSGYAVGDEFTLQVKSGMSDAMTGKIHMTTGSVTAINITNEGANYIFGKVDIVIASPGLTGTTATATVTTVSNGRIASINITNGGTNYSSAPSVTILNEVEKVQALATATVNSNGNITGFTMNSIGNGYLTVPTVTLATQIPGIGSGASAVAVLTGGTVSGLNPINGGSGYTGVNTPVIVQNAPASIHVNVKGSGTTINNINLGTGKRSIEN